jgi:heavy metal sensor kinase
VVYASPDLTDPTVLAALASMPSSASDRVACSFAGRHEETRVRAASVALPTGSHDLIVAVPWDRSEDFLLKTLLVIATVISVFLAISSVGAWLLVGRSLAPIDQIVTVAEHLSADSLSPHLLPASAVSDSEVGHVVAALNDMMARLYDSFERQKRFTADASHELRMPLTVLQGEIELGLARERSNEELCDILRSSLEETHRLTDIVESLSALAIADVGVLSARERSESVDLDKLCREVVTTFGNRASEKNVALGYETAGSAVTVIGNSDSLRRLVNNLVQNGIAYTDSGGAVTVTLSTENGSASIVVRDTGIGISAADLPHIFERFYRADKARSNAGGAGLGLSIVASIVKAHRGTVAVKSEVGHGSEFHVALPLA